MKTNLLACVAGWLMLLSYLPSTAQNTTTEYQRSLVLKTNLFGPLSLLVERPIAPRMSLQLSVQQSKLVFFGTYRYFNITPELKFYFSRQPATERLPHPSGLYVSPYLKYRRVRDIDEDVSTGPSPEVSYRMVGGGVTVGTQVIFQSGFTLDFFGGGGYYPFIRYYALHTPPNVEANIRPDDFRIDFRLVSAWAMLSEWLRTGGLPLQQVPVDQHFNHSFAIVPTGGDHRLTYENLVAFYRGNIILGHQIRLIGTDKLLVGQSLFNAFERNQCHVFALGGVDTLITSYQFAPQWTLSTIFLHRQGTYYNPVTSSR